MRPFTEKTILYTVDSSGKLFYTFSLTFILFLDPFIYLPTSGKKKIEWGRVKLEQFTRNYLKPNTLQKFNFYFLTTLHDNKYSATNLTKHNTTLHIK